MPREILPQGVPANVIVLLQRPPEAKVVFLSCSRAAAAGQRKQKLSRNGRRVRSVRAFPIPEHPNENEGGLCMSARLVCSSFLRGGDSFGARDAAGRMMTRPVWVGKAWLEEFETAGASGKVEGLTQRVFNLQSRQWRL